MSDFAINAALVRAWQGAGIAYPTAYEGKTFDPAVSAPDGSPWAEFYLLPANTAPAAIGIHAPLEHVGVLQIDLKYALDTGAPLILKDADTVRDHFSPGASFVYEGMQVNIERSWRSSIRRSDDRLVVSLSVRWRGWQHRVTP